MKIEKEIENIVSSKPVDEAYRWVSDNTFGVRARLCQNEVILPPVALALIDNKR